MLRHVIEATPKVGLRLALRFDDGTKGEVDLRSLIRFEGVFSPLADPAYLARVQVDEDFGTVYWPNGADLDPIVLYCAVRGIPVSDYLAETEEMAG